MEEIVWRMIRMYLKRLLYFQGLTAFGRSLSKCENSVKLGPPVFSFLLCRAMIIYNLYIAERE